jgi:diguanylate cyclase (GGDEF)-like protein
MPGTSVRVLLVEGNAGTVHLMRMALREVGPDFDLTWADGLNRALTLAAGSRFDVVLLDPTLADVPGAEAVLRLRQVAPDVPLLLLASAADVAVCLRAMEQGAHDYLFKDVLTTHLLARMIRDAVERYRPAAPSGNHLIDPVTGLANHDGLLAQAALLWRTPGRLRKGATLLYLALEGLAVINAAAGQAAGDRALVETADVLRDTFRGSDLRARLAGADFVVLAVGAPEPTTPILISRLEENLQACNAHDRRNYYLVLRAGSAHYDADRPCIFEELMDAARDGLGSVTLGRRSPSLAAAHEAAAS